MVRLGLGVAPGAWKRRPGSCVCSGFSWSLAAAVLLALMPASHVAERVKNRVLALAMGSPEQSGRAGAGS